MFNSIVVGTDGSVTAAAAVRRAVDLARLSGARLHVVTAFRPVEAVASVAAASSYSSGLAVNVAQLGPEQRREAEAIAERAVPPVDADDIEVECHARPGNPAEVIVEVARHIGADLIIVGNRGMNGARRLLGSVPNRVTHSAPCAVMVVHTAGRVAATK